MTGPLLWCLFVVSAAGSLSCGAIVALLQLSTIWRKRRSGAGHGPLAIEFGRTWLATCVVLMRILLAAIVVGQQIHREGRR